MTEGITVSSYEDFNGQTVLTAELDEEPAGVLCFRDAIDDVYVLPEFRRQGVARALYQHALSLRPGLQWGSDMSVAGEKFARSTGWAGTASRLDGKRYRDWLRFMRTMVRDAQISKACAS